MLPASPEVTLQQTALTFVIAPTQWQGLFDRLEVWRSRSGPDGPYEALTGDVVSPAVLPVGFTGSPPSPPIAGPSLSISGLQLQFVLDGIQSVTILFTGTNPLSLGEAATQINAQAAGILFSYVYGSTLVVTTVQGGASASLQCVAGDAAAVLGFDITASGVAFGQDARLILQPTLESYSYNDPYGSNSFYYKIRFYNSVTELTSTFSIPVQGASLPQAPALNLVRCYVDLSDAQGLALQNQEVFIHTRFNGAQAGIFTVVGAPIVMLTDSNGHAELMLVRGASFTVAIGGTSLARDVTVPTDPTVLSINLLDPSLGTDDLFAVQVPQLNYATRRSL